MVETVPGGGVEALCGQVRGGEVMYGLPGYSGVCDARRL